MTSQHGMQPYWGVDMKSGVIRTFLSATVLCVLLLMPAMADSVSTEIDPFSGLPADKSGSATETSREDGLISISAGVYYDSVKRTFAHDISEVLPAMLYCTVPDGTVTDEMVSITVPGGCSAQLYRNGVQLDSPNFSAISKPGSYVLCISGSTADSIQPLRFTIVDEVTGLIDSYRMPDGFLISAVTLNGDPVPYSAAEADLSREGNYSVQYRCEAADLNWRLDVTTDHTPPQLRLEAVTDGYAKGPVDISDVEEGASVFVELDGKSIAYEKTLTRSGAYRIVLTDKAGNTTEYRFTILVYFNVSSYIFIAVLVIFIIALLVYLRVSSKRLRVR